MVTLRPSRLVAYVAGGVCALAAVACVQTDPDHCALQGGDLACSDGAVCVASIRAGNVAPGEQANGCADPDPDAELFVAVPYGLPGRLGIPGDDGVGSMAGVLERVAPGCVTSEDDLQPLAASVSGIGGVRDHLQQRPQAKASAFDLSPAHVEAITALGTAVDDFIGACEPDSMTTGTDSGTGTGADSGTSSTDGGTTTSGDDCLDDEDCQGAMGGPFCDPASGQCVECGGDDPDGVCMRADPTAPLCVDGACGQCTAEQTAACDDAGQVCELGTSTCVGCTAHEQCGSGACDRMSGQCFAEDEITILHVDGDGGQPFTTIAEALGSAAAQTPVIVVHERDGGEPYEESVFIEVSGTVIVMGAPGERPVLRGLAGQAAITAGGNRTTVYLDRLSVSAGGAGSLGLQTDRATLWIDRTVIANSAGGAVRAAGGGELVLHNCFVGGDAVDVDAVVVEDATARIVYSTIGAGAGGSAAIQCAATSAVEVRNSILLARSDEDEVQCEAPVIEYTASERDRGGTNVDLGGLSATWFANYLGGDFHLTAEAPEALTTTARWESGDVSTDLDGDARGGIDGVMEHAGGDVPGR